MMGIVGVTQEEEEEEHKQNTNQVQAEGRGPRNLNGGLFPEKKKNSSRG